MDSNPLSNYQTHRKKNCSFYLDFENVPSIKSIQYVIVCIICKLTVHILTE